MLDRLNFAARVFSDERFSVLTSFAWRRIYCAASSRCSSARTATARLVQAAGGRSSSKFDPGRDLEDEPEGTIPSRALLHIATKTVAFAARQEGAGERTVCDVCLKRLGENSGESKQRCSKCSIATYCSAACQRLPWNAGHKAARRTLRGAV